VSYGFSGRNTVGRVYRQHTLNEMLKKRKKEKKIKRRKKEEKEQGRVEN
jgi:uncharacterized protein YaiI (UPF0178 family)